jgi:hypothetical protein
LIRAFWASTRWTRAVQFGILVSLHRFLGGR